LLAHPADGSVEDILIGQGGVIGDFSFDNQNTFTFNAPAEIFVQSTTTITNEGTINSAGGTLVNNGSVENNAGGAVTIGAVVFNNQFFEGRLTNNAGATLTNAAGAALAIEILANSAGGTFTNNGNAGVNDGISQTGGFEQATNAGTLANNPGATLGIISLTNAAGGTLTNAGELGDFGLTNGGTLNNQAGGTLGVFALGFGTLTNQAGGQLINNGTLGADILRARRVDTLSTFSAGPAQSVQLIKHAGAASPAKSSGEDSRRRLWSRMSRSAIRCKRC